MARKSLLGVLALLFLSSTVYAAGIGELMDIARAQADAQKTYASETRAFERVKAAIDNGAIKKGQSKKEIADRYGEPVVNMTDSATGREKWIYKSAKSSFFEGTRIYLYFDKNGNLDEVKVVE